MVMAYLLIGAITLLLAYPSRDTSGPLVRLFWRYWVWLAALPVLLLFIAVFRRIADYGVTEPRYLIALVGVWALILAGARILSGERFDLRIVPGALSLLMLAASFGPGGAVGFSVMSQKEELAAILTEKGVLVDGKIVPQTNADPNLYGDEAWRCAASNGTSTCAVRSACSRPGSRGCPTIPSRPAKRRRRRRGAFSQHSVSAPIFACKSAEDFRYSAASRAGAPSQASRSASARAESARLRSKPFELRGPLPRA